MDHDVTNQQMFLDPYDFFFKKKCNVCGEKWVIGSPRSGCPGAQKVAAPPTPEFVRLDFVVSPPSERAGCECGSFKALGIQKGMAGHSTWCPWSAA